MSDPFLAEIRIFGFNYAPYNWAFCNGQLLPINQNSALYSLVGTFYGGDGRSTFGLPNLQGSTTCSMGQGPGLTQRNLGQTFGSANVTLQTPQIPTHQHSFLTLVGTGAQQQNNPTAGCHLAHTLLQYDYNKSVPPNTTLGPVIGVAGSSTPHPNQQPYLAMNFCICLNGQYPSRN